MDDAHMRVHMWAGRRGYGRSRLQSGTALIRRRRIASTRVPVGMPAGLEHKQTHKKCQRQRGRIETREDTGRSLVEDALK